MKLVELLQNQEVIIQLVWSEQQIEFHSNVIEKDDKRRRTYTCGLQGARRK